MLIVWKGGSSRIKLTDSETTGVIIGVGAAVALLVAVFFLPWLYRRLIKEDWQLKWYHLFMGPLVLRRGEVPPPPEGYKTVQDYYKGHKTLEELERERANIERAGPSDEESEPAVDKEGKEGQAAAASVEIEEPQFTLIGPRPDGAAFSPAVLFWQFRRFFFRGIEQDVVSLQKKRNILTGDLEMVHAHARHYDNKAEYMYSFLQVMTASTASFTHGANDVSKYVSSRLCVLKPADRFIQRCWSLCHHLLCLVNQPAQVQESRSVLDPVSSHFDIHRHILINLRAFGGAAIVIGLWTYGYNIMRNLGNRITLHSPSRGFSMELGSAITVIMATKLSMLHPLCFTDHNRTNCPQSSPSPPRSVSLVPQLVWACAMAPGEPSTGA